jgi:hypothetical protein
VEDGIWFRRRQKTVSIVFRAELTRMEEPGVSFAKNENPPEVCVSGRGLGNAHGVPRYMSALLGNTSAWQRFLTERPARDSQDTFLGASGALTGPASR